MLQISRKGVKMTHRKVQWIKYQMTLKRITQENIATSAGCSQSMVSQVLYGRKRSAKVRKAIIAVLGCDPFEKLPANYKES
jgi:transcriptional regulator with XRE-family HTH domain